MWGMVAGLEVIANIYNIRPRWKWLENDSEFRVVTSESLRGDPLLSTLRFLPRRSDLPDQADIDGLSGFLQLSFAGSGITMCWARPDPSLYLTVSLNFA